MRAFRRKVKGEGSGFSILEMIIVLVILALLATAAIPLVRNAVKAERETELREALRQLRDAIDAYKKYSDLNPQLIPVEWKSESGYPKTLQILVDGFIPANTIGTEDKKVRFLRKIPVDPMTKSTDWGMRGYTDKPDASSWNGEDVFDVYSHSKDKAMNGTNYKDW